MTLRQANYLDTHSTDATFRSLCQSIHDNFAAMGLIQTADTGQINLTTVTRPASTVVAGYEIWQFADTLQATAPIFFKFEYGAASTSSFGFFVTTGSGSDGAGNITVTSGSITPRKQLNSQNLAASGTLMPCYFNYMADGTGFGLMYWPAGSGLTTYGALFFAIERFRNADGSANADGWNVFYAYAATNIASAVQDGRFSGSVGFQPSAVLNSWAVPQLPGLSTLHSTVLNTTMYPLPVSTGAYPRPAGPSQLLLAVGKNDLNAGATVAVSHYGSAHAWVAAGLGGNGGWGPIDPLSRTTSFLMRAD